MRAAEFLQKLAELIDTVENCSDDKDCCNSSEKSTNVMVPPLQQKLELLKKASNVDSIYTEPSEPEPTEIGAPESTNDNIVDDSKHETANELKRLKKNAGLVATIENSDDFLA